MAYKLTANVGKGGKNQPEDVKHVQTLLNPFAGEVGFPKLQVNGQPSHKLEKAISGFQEKVCLFRPDGRVDPGKRTIKKLEAGPSKAKAEKKAEEKKVQTVKSQEQAKALSAIKKEAEKAAKAKKVPQSSWADLWKTIEKEATDLFDSYWADCEKKGGTASADAAQKEAKKIAQSLNNDVKKKIDNKIKEADTGGVEYPGKVTGKVTGVNKPLMDALWAVSSHYEGTPIKVVSGKRDKKGQADAMFNGWTEHLVWKGKNGGIYWFCRQSQYQDLWKELDDLKAQNDRAGFVDCMLKKAPWGSVSKHLTGDAVDIALSTDKKIIEALKMVFKHYLAEKSGNSEGIKCHHFDNKEGIKKVDDALRAKFPK